MKIILKLGTIFIFLPAKIALYNMSVKVLHQHSINNYKNICKGASFSIHILEKLEGYNFINGQRDFTVQKLCLQREDYWMKTLCTIYPYGLNEKAKNSNLE